MKRILIFIFILSLFSSLLFAQNSRRVYRRKSLTTTDSLLVKGDLTVNGEVHITQLFAITIDSTSIATTEKITFFYTPCAITIDSVIYVGEGTTSVTPDIHFGTDRSAAGTAIITSPAAATSVTTGDRITSFDNDTITANSFVWIEFDAVGTCPNEFSITLCGRK
jgi:hypothetical protein